MDQSAPMSTTNILLLIVAGIEIAITYSLVFVFVFFSIPYHQWPSTLPTTRKSQYIRTFSPKQPQNMDQSALKSTADDLILTVAYLQITIVYLFLFAFYFFFIRSKSALTKRITQHLDDHKPLLANSKPAAEKAYTQALVTDMEEEKKEMQLLKKMLKEKKKARDGWKVDGGEKGALEKGAERGPDVGHASEEEGFEWVEKNDA